MADIRKRKLGRTNIMVPEIAVGGIPIMRVEDKEEAAELVRYALDQGITYLDTARAYGDSEEKFGMGIEGRRDQVFLATKTHAYDYDTAWQYLETSLKELKTDYVDLWQMHDISTQERWDKIWAPDGAMKAAHEARDQGLVKFIGLTGHNDDLLVRAIETDEFDVILCVYNLGIHSAGERVIPLAQERNVGVAVMKPLSGGLFFRREEAYIDPMKAWHFVLMNPGITVALAGFQNRRDIDQAVQASLNFQPLSEEEIAELVEKARFFGDDVCRDCGYCKEVCPAGIDIPTIMKMFDEARVFSYEWPRFRRIYAELEPKADACTDCGQCEEKCPFDLKIRERLQWVHQRFNQPV
ncbi:MAG: aldo/keto reductase [Armatimonadetes bacterium]|nr:aldo/keto reductase [Armatimonadota bacterium]